MLEAARYAGIDVRKNILLAMAISGGTAGLAGGVEIAGVAFRLYQQISPGFGFDAIAVSLLANNNPLGVIFSGILFGALRSGSDMMQITAKIPSVLVFSIQGLVILAVVAFGVYRQRRRRKAEEGTHGDRGRNCPRDNGAGSHLAPGHPTHFRLGRRAFHGAIGRAQHWSGRHHAVRRICRVRACSVTGSPIAGLVAAIVAGLLLGLIFAVFTVTYQG